MTAPYEVVSRYLSTWDVKSAAGFDSDIPHQRAGEQGFLTTRVCGVLFREPIEISWASADGFGYRTRPGHPVDGEESFTARAVDDDTTMVTIRSYSRPASWVWTLLWPAVRVRQRAARRDYEAAIRSLGAAGQRTSKNDN